jgi:hypothetical protein
LIQVQWWVAIDRTSIDTLISESVRLKSGFSLEGLDDLGIKTIQEEAQKNVDVYRQQLDRLDQLEKKKNRINLLLKSRLRKKR